MKIRILAIVLGALCLLGCPDKKHSANDGHDHGAEAHSSDDGHDHGTEKKKSEEHKSGDGHDH
ncbi:MAG TPA: hypothetical protein DEA08_34830 [Planctomycetes bacterium]|nr:hypothetical protein [Planctomycetota bacterium]|tara:strand:- start:553 stop:741 length:189 start_codon:yes stop_codon:yes gene_type:complete